MRGVEGAEHHQVRRDGRHGLAGQLAEPEVGSSARHKDIEISYDLLGTVPIRSALKAG